MSARELAPGEALGTPVVPESGSGPPAAPRACAEPLTSNLIIDSIILQCQIWMLEKCERYNFNFEDLEKIR
jgi:hypothetical protein